MKVIKTAILIFIFLIAQSSYAYEFKSQPFSQKPDNTKKKWNFQKDGTLQRFELRHGDTFGFDKTHDGQRVEVHTLWSNRTSAGKSYTRSKEIWTAAMLKVILLGDFLCFECVYVILYILGLSFLVLIEILYPNLCSNIT